MYTGQLYGLWQTLYWSRSHVVVPLVWSLAVTGAYVLTGHRWLAIPTLPITLIGVAVAFYLGFKNSASYERLWEARKIWGAIVNASRSWALGTRDLVSDLHGARVEGAELERTRLELVRRHVAWLDALRHQLRQVKSWEHRGPAYEKLRSDMAVAEYGESLADVLGRNVAPEEAAEVLAKINPAAHLLGNQSRRLAELREQKLLDGFAHVELQRLLEELMAEQGKAERIKNFPFPRQYSTVNSLFARLFAFLVPFGLLGAFREVGEAWVWLTVPFATVVSWVFLTTDRIGDWSENPFEGLANDVPITTMARAIERDLLELVGETELPPPREPRNGIQF